MRPSVTVTSINSIIIVNLFQINKTSTLSYFILQFQSISICIIPNAGRNQKYTTGGPATQKAVRSRTDFRQVDRVQADGQQRRVARGRVE